MLNWKQWITAGLTCYAAWAFAAADANQATPAELAQIKGIGPATAERIVQARTQAPFKDWQDFIARIKGVAETTAAKLSAQGLTINGQSFAPTSAGVPSAPSPAASEPASAKPTQQPGKKTDKI